MAEGFLADLVGIHDVRDNGGSLIARRTTLDFVGAEVADDPTNAQTVVTFKQRHDTEIVTLSASAQLSNTDADAYRITHTDAGHVVYGLTAPTTGQRRRAWIMNPHASLSLTLKHESSSASAAANRFTAAGAADLVIPPGGAALAIYDDTAQRWGVY